MHSSHFESLENEISDFSDECDEFGNGMEYLWYVVVVDGRWAGREGRGRGLC